MSANIQNSTTEVTTDFYHFLVWKRDGWVEIKLDTPFELVRETDSVEPEKYTSIPQPSLVFHVKICYDCMMNSF